MRTTVILPDELLRQVKERARAEHRTVTSFLEEALRRELARREESPAAPFAAQAFSPPPGWEGTLPGVDIADKEQVQSLLDDEDFAVRQVRAGRTGR